MPPTAVHTPPSSATSDVGASDRHLVAQAARGEQRSFELLFQRHRAGVQAYALRMLGDHAAAEDVVQDVFVSAMRSLRGGTKPVHVRAWLQEIARCACVDHWRGSERRREVSYDAPDSLSGKDARQMAVSGDVAMRGAADRESLAYLQSAFQDLPPLQHRVLVQRELEGRSSNEIAERLGISPTVVEGQLARGRRSLAVSFRELQSGERCIATRELCEASLDRPLGVRDRARVRVHLRTCSSCRRHARAAGVEPRLFDPRVLSHLGFLLPIPLLRRFPLASIFASSESVGVAISSKALVGAAMIAAGGGSALVMTDIGPGRSADPAPVARAAEPPLAFPAAGRAVVPGTTAAPTMVLASATGSLPLSTFDGAPGIRLAVPAAPAEDERHRGGSSSEPKATKDQRQRNDAQGAVTPGFGQREALAGTMPTPMTLPRYTPSTPPRVQRLAPIPADPNDGGTPTDGTRDRQLPVPTPPETKIGTEPVVEPAPEPEPVAEEPPVTEEPTTDPGTGGGETPPVEGGVTDPEPDPGEPEAGGTSEPEPAPAAAAEGAPSAPVEQG